MQKDYCRNSQVDNPFMPRKTVRGPVEEHLGGSYLDKLPPYFLSGSECNGDVDEPVWKAGQKLVWMLAS